MRHLYNLLSIHRLPAILCFFYLYLTCVKPLDAQNPLRVRLYVDAPLIDLDSHNDQESAFAINRFKNYGLGLELEKKLNKLINLSFNVMHTKNYYSPVLYTIDLNFDNPTIRCSNLHTSFGVGFNIDENNIFYYQPGITFIFSEFTNGFVTNEEHGKKESLSGRKLHTKNTFYHSLRYTRIVSIFKNWNFAISGNLGFNHGEDIIKDFLRYENARMSIQLGFLYSFNKKN